jgi:hypothetical protein
MMKQRAIWELLLFCSLIFSSFAGCKGREDKKPLPKGGKTTLVSVSSPPGYNLAAPVKFVLSERLQRISGICFLRSDPDTLYAIEDETGKLYYFHLGNGRFPFRHFGGRGDYEDVTVLDDKEFVVLRSDGSLFVFPVSIVRDRGKVAVRSYEHILPAGKYEGLFCDEDGRLIALCKSCAIDDPQKEVSGYVLGYGAGHALAIRDHFKVEVARFHPSCLARNPKTKEWYLISSVNKTLFVLDDQWKLKENYTLDPILFKQPEGLAFDRDGNMYISNEGGEGRPNVLVFKYKP